MADSWIDSSHDNLSMNKEDYNAFNESSISLLPIILNSPPESVKSHTSYDDADCSYNNIFLNTSNEMMEQEKSFDFVDESTLIQPVKYSQDIVYPGANSFQEEIEMVSNERTFSICNNNNTIDFIKSEDDTMDELDTPILGDDLMFSRQSAFKFNQHVNEKMNENMKFTIEAEEDADVNVNIMMPAQNVQPKLLAKRNQQLPKLHLKIKMCPIINGNNTNMEEKAITNTGVISTPQLTKEILEMENDFDLVNYIDADHVSAVKNKLQLFF